jgi:cytochrome c biogenesis protein CcmG/thiol:disulfide interchange protein DsbE
MAPEFRLADGNGALVDLSRYKGKVVLLNFWATTCGGCKIEIPWFMEFEKKYKGSGLAVIGVALDEEGWKAVKPFVEATKMNYTVVIGGDDLAKLYGVESMPATFLIGRDGRIVRTDVGRLVDRVGCEKEIRKLLGARAE